jgi:hypothetical protein
MLLCISNTTGEPGMVATTFRRLRKKELEFKTCLGYTVRSCLKNKTAGYGATYL